MGILVSLMQRTKFRFFRSAIGILLQAPSFMNHMKRPVYSTFSLIVNEQSFPFSGAFIFLILKNTLS